MTDFLEDVREESERTSKGHDDFLLDHYAWFVILSEEVGEVAKAINHNQSAEEVMAELVQVASVAKCWYDILEGGEK